MPDGADSLPSIPVADRSAWTRADLEADPSWLVRLTPRHLEEIEQAVEGLRRNTRSLETVTREDFPFPTLAVDLNRMLWREVATGRGMAVLRGLDPTRYSDAEVGMLFWGIGLHLGQGVSQNAAGDRLGHVFDQGLDYHARNVRRYQTSHQLNFHVDSGDVVGLLCLRRAKSGGLSSVASATTLFNILLRERPDLLAVLARGFEFDRRGEATPFQGEVSGKLPVFACVDGDLSVRYVGQAIRTARKKLGVPFTEEETAALDHLDAAARREEVHFSMMLEPGDMQFCNNYLVLHSRTAFEDWPEPARRRHMLRLWLKIHVFRKLDPVQCDHDAESGWSRRDGILPRGATMRDGRLLPAAE